MHDVAEAAGVSVATVSNVVNGGVPVSDTKQKKVRKAIRALGYQHNLAAKAFKTGISSTLGLLVPNLSNPYFSSLAKLVIDSARTRGYVVAAIDTQDSSTLELDSLDFLLKHGVQGVLWFDPRSSEKAIRSQTSVNHLVIVDRRVPQLDSVFSKQEDGAYALAEYLVAQGHVDIGLISGPQRNDVARRRRRGILRALKNRATIRWECENEFSKPLSPDAIACLERRDVSAIMCGSDAIALTAMHELNRLSISIPDQVSITGFDDIFLCELVSPKLTTVGIPAEPIVEEAVELLIRRTRGDTSPIRHVSMGVELVIRDSVAAVR